MSPNLPTRGTGSAEWRGFLPAAAHPQAIDPAQGYLASWNNKPAPGFPADDNYSFGPVQRVQSLNEEIARQLALHHGKLTEANLVTAMEMAASVDRTGRHVTPDLLAETSGRAEPAGVRAMLAQLRSWVAAGALRRKAAPGDPQYAHAAAVAIMDELWPRLVRALFDPLFAAGLPGRLGRLPGEDPRSGAGQAGRPAAAGRRDRPRLRRRAGLLPGRHRPGLAATYQALVTANGGSTDVASWTQDTATRAAGQTMPVYDDIQFQAVGIVGQPAIDWQNRPTFQQVAEFPAHR